MEYRTVVGGCPLCKSDVYGSEQSKFLCTNCKLLFSKPGREKTPEPEKKPFVTSPQSKSYHIPTCKYAKRIEHPITLTPDQTIGMRACSCTKGVVE